MKPLKIIALIFGTVLILMIAVISYIAATFNPNDYKAKIIAVVQEKQHRTLTIPGDITLSVFPKIAVSLGKVSVSEINSPQEFATVDNAKVSLALMPLLSKQVVVDRVVIDGLKARIHRMKDGRTNLGSPAPSAATPATPSGGEAGAPPLIDIVGITLTNASITLVDDQAGRTTSLSPLNLETGPIANGKASQIQLKADLANDKPAVKVGLQLKSGFLFDIEKKQVSLKDLDAQISGAIAPFKETLFSAKGSADINLTSNQYVFEKWQISVTAKDDKQSLEANVSLPQLAMSDNAVKGGPFSAKIKMQQPGQQVDADIKGEMEAGAQAGQIRLPKLTVLVEGKQGDVSIKGDISAAVLASIKTKEVELDKLAINLTLPNPAGGALTFKANGKVQVDGAKESVQATMRGQIDQSNFDGRLALNRFSPPQWKVDLNIDALDVDRYVKKEAAPVTAKSSEPEKPFDLSFLKTLHGSATVAVGSFKIYNLKMNQAKVALQVSNGVLNVNPMSASLYGGSVSGSLSANATAPARFTMNQSLNNVNLRPLLLDAIGKEPIEGQGNAKLDLTASGNTVADIKKNLNGTVQLNLRDGAVRGVNLASTIRNAKSKLGLGKSDNTQQGTASAGEKTDFSEMSGSLRVTNGIAHNDDLTAKSPLFRVSGAGDINLIEEKLDYLVKATVVTTLQGQGGPELEALKGLTVPVKLSGPLTAMNWKIDFGSLATDAAKTKVKEKLKDKLKGLFGR